MSAVPAFEIGVWNAWIFLLYHSLPMPLMMLARKESMQEASKAHSEIERKLYPVVWILWFAAVIYSIFLPLQVGTVWFYVGLPISLVGSIAYAAVFVSHFTTQMEKEPLTRGLYRYSRHPMYVTQFVVFIGVGIACASWVFLLFTLAYTIFSGMLVTSEENHCLEMYGDAYREYMKRTPRWIGIPKPS
jgi:protein-S-isoprenylcysteine O-methyltransferase Ste14